jgi:hypothetical protein
MSSPVLWNQKPRLAGGWCEIVQWIVKPGLYCRRLLWFKTLMKVNFDTAFRITLAAGVTLALLLWLEAPQPKNCAMKLDGFCIAGEIR